MKKWLRLFRVHQYVKNGFVFLPTFFAGDVPSVSSIGELITAFISFSLAASSIYVFNDIHDREADRLHPIKKNRPIASGEISPNLAAIATAAMSALAVFSMWLVSTKAAWVLIAYLAINVAYTIRLKHTSLLDVTVIAIGFVLRLFVGSHVSSIKLSMWIVVMTFLLALFMALAKRRDDLVLLDKTGEKMRKSLDGYTLPFVDAAMMISAAIVIVSYIMYTTSLDAVMRMNNEHLYISALFVMMGILRYMQITFVEEKSGSPTRIALTDRFIQASVLCWLFFFYCIIYL